MKSFRLIFLTVFVSLTAAKLVTKPRIIGGQEVKEGQFPYQVSLRIYNEHFCGGSILNSRFILSAAHCGATYKFTPVYAIVGALHRTKGGVAILVKIIQHEGWNEKTLLHDITLLRTAQEIVFSDTVQPIALPINDLPEEGNVAVVLSGWGRNNVSDWGESETLQYIESRTISLNDCIKRHNEPRDSALIHVTSVCTLNKAGKSGCNGDSGGPLVDVTDPEHKTLVGIISWGRTCAQGDPAVYTRVYPYLDWIQKKMKEHSNDLESVHKIPTTFEHR